MKIAEVERINGFFKAFEWINHKTNHGYTFEVTAIPRVNNPIEAINYYIFHDDYSSEMPEVKTKELSNIWKTIIKEKLHKWLFSYQTDPCNMELTLQDTRKYYSLSDEEYKNEMIDELLESFATLGHFRQCISVELNYEDVFYELYYDDLLLFDNDGSLYIHFGVSD